MVERQVRLFTGQVHDGLWCSIRAYVDAQSGNLVIETEDAGKNVDAFLGREDSDYEYSIRIAAADKPALVRQLAEEVSIGAAAEADADEELLSMLERKYGGNFQASANLRKWLDEQRIPYTFESWP